MIRLLTVATALLYGSLAFAYLDKRVIVVIEEPVQGERYSGISNLRGYAVSPEGMGDYYLNVYIDGNLAFYMAPYGQRTDVGNAFPDYPDSDTGGFSMAFNYKDLSPGEHEIRVEAFDNAGNYNSAVTTFTSERFVSSFISADSLVNVRTTNTISIIDNQSYLMTGVTVEGRQWDFVLSWDRASQGFKTEQIRASGVQSDTTGGTLISSDQDDCEGQTGFGAEYGCTSGNGGSSNSGSGDSNLTGSNGRVYACMTYRERDRPNDDTIAMENGLELHTSSLYNSLGYESLGYEWQIVFKSLAGDWYMIVDEAQLITIDVLREPDTCREYPYGEVVNVVYDYEGGKLLEFSNYQSAIVEASCPIGLGAKLASYKEKTSGTGWETDGKKSFIVDLLTVDVCEVEWRLG